MTMVTVRKKKNGQQLRVARELAPDFEHGGQKKGFSVVQVRVRARLCPHDLRVMQR